MFPFSFSIILRLVGVLTVFCNLAEALLLKNNVTISDHPIILVVSYDGFRYDYFEKVSTPNLNSLKAAGVRVPYMEPVFPTKTFPNHQSIVTGVYSETHGIVDNVIFDKKLNKTLNGFTDDPGFWNYHSDVLPIWIRNEQAGDGRVSGCLMWPGSAHPYGKDNTLLPTYFYPKYNASVPWEDRVNMVISWITNSTNPANLVFTYFDEPDSHGHAFGPNAPETLVEVSNADNRTAYLVNKLKEMGIFENVNLIMLSDHGMKEVTAKHIVNISEMIDPDHLRFKHGGTPFIHLIANEGRGDDLYSNLTKLSKDNHFSIYKNEEMKVHPFHYSESRRILDYIVVADAGYAFDDFYDSIASYNEKWNLAANDSREYGVHGYSNVATSMRPYFIAYGPAFKKDMDHKPIRNVDIVPLISNLLSLPELPYNGSFSRVADMISPTFKPKQSAGNYIPSASNALYIGVVTSILNLQRFEAMQRY